MKNSFLLTLIASALFISCKKEDTIAVNETGDMQVEFDNVVGSQDLQLNTGTYTNVSGEAFTVTTFDYYVSNIKLKKADGTEYALPKDSSYFLIKESGPSQAITLKNIPAGDYTGIAFTIGVDSLKCTAPLAQRTGVLDPAGSGADMYWTWNSGYIFLRMEGTSPASTMPDKKIYYHIGGFGGYSSPTINNLKSISLTAPSGMMAKVRNGKHPEMHLFADVAKVLNGGTNVSIAANTMVMFAPYSVNIANNYAGMFSINHIHNN